MVHTYKQKTPKNFVIIPEVQEFGGYSGYLGTDETTIFPRKLVQRALKLMKADIKENPNDSNLKEMIPILEKRLKQNKG